MRKLYILFLLLTLGGWHTAARASETDSIRVSLMTCSPGSEIYALFGHTAIRVEVPSQDIDWVYNYGMFSFNTPHFVFRFVTGETDYQLGIIPYPYFEEEYRERGSYVVEQELNLRPEEKVRLVGILQRNYLPENRTYRYNYFYDNCTTRARDRIEESIAGRVVYPVNRQATTFRQIIHRFTAGHPWDEFGIDLVLGAEADRAIDTRTQMFSPFVMMAEADSAVIRQADGETRPLVKATRRVVEASAQPSESSFPLSPMTCACLLLALSAVVSWAEWRHGMPSWWFDTLLFALQGLAGCIVAFLFFFSLHPTVGSNYLLIILNPIPLIYLPWMIYKSLKGRKDAYHVGSAVVLTLFIVFWWLIPQKITLVILPLALSLLMRSVTRILVTRKARK